MTPWRKIMSVRAPSFGGTKAQMSFGSASSSGAHQEAGVVEDGEAVAAGAGSSAAAGATGNRDPARAKAPRAAARQGGALIETCIS
jgi:hypothetical protein